MFSRYFLPERTRLCVGISFLNDTDATSENNRKIRLTAFNVMTVNVLK